MLNLQGFHCFLGAENIRTANPCKAENKEISYFCCTVSKKTQTEAKMLEAIAKYMSMYMYVFKTRGNFK
jgi:hypothetical protein